MFPTEDVGGGGEQSPPTSQKFAHPPLPPSRLPPPNFYLPPKVNSLPTK